MRIGYSAWGFVGDGIIDSPDGGRVTRALFLEHLIKDGNEIIWLQQNRDVENGRLLFCEENKEKYRQENNQQRETLCNIKYNEDFPDIDILFVEWRWKIRGRNCNVDIDSDKYTPDLDRQNDLLAHYIKTKTKIFIWDKDETMTFFDENYLFHGSIASNVTVFSPALYPIRHIYPRTTLHFPCDLAKIRGTKVNKEFLWVIGYIGSQYERDEQVYKYINPIVHQFSVKFVGNWLKYPEKAKHNMVNFPHIIFEDRIQPKDMSKVYHQCLTSVLLCKSNYSAHGHITQRIHETLSNGVINIGLSEQRGIENFIPKNLIVTDAYDLKNVLTELTQMTILQRQNILDNEIERLEPFDIHNVMKVFKEAIQ